MTNSPTIKRLVPVFLHVSAWGLLLLFFLFTDDNTEDKNSFLVRMINLLCYFVPFVSFFYLNSLYLVKRYLIIKQFKRYFFYLFLAFVSLQLIECVLGYIDYLYFLSPEERGPVFLWEDTAIDNLFFVLFILGLSYSYTFLMLWSKNEKLKKESELKLLKSQMNPHFLFNSLNALYSLISDREVEKAEDAIIKLSNLLRYSVYQVNTSKISLVDEINYIRNYVDMQELRLPKEVQITTEIDEPSEEYSIEPMLLIPFVENAFKHGISYIRKSEIYIKLRLKEGTLYFTVLNTINEKNRREDDFSGVGIVNVKSRLALLYPSLHNLTIENKDENYVVSLMIEKIN